MNRADCLTLLFWLAFLACFRPTFGDEIVFERDIAPILVANCYECHGPSSKDRQGELRLDRLAPLIVRAPNRETLINPGHAEQSRLYLRIVSHNPDLRMPPATHAERLSPQQQEAIRRWIEEGAEHRSHWAFEPPVRPPLPVVRDTSWVQSPIDSFVLNRLEAEGLQPSPRADPYTLIRRASLDLNGVPPSLEEARAGAAVEFDQAIDRWLAHPAYGERMAQDWLDAARYADTTGHAADQPRTMWLYRDWVVQALNEGMPFDQFTGEQLAGDLLPTPDVDQLIATGFLRNSMQALGNNPRKEEFRVKGIVDRLETLSRVWMGISMACAECHDHKYDPVTQKEYYELFAIFNNVPHLGERFQVHGPRLEVLPDSASREIQLLSERLERRRHELRQDSRTPADEAARFTQWIANPSGSQVGLRPSVHVDFRDPLLIRPVESWQGPELPAERFNRSQPYPQLNTVALKPGDYLLVDDSRIPQLTADFSIGVWIKTRSTEADLVTRYDWKSKRRAFVFGIGGQGEPGSQPGHLYAWISATANPFSGIVAYGSLPVNDGQWHHVGLKFVAGSSVELFVDGESDSAVRFEGKPPETVAPATLPLLVAAGYDGTDHPSKFFYCGEIADLRIYDRPLNARQIGAFSATERTALSELHSGTPVVSSELRETYRRICLSGHEADQELRSLESRILELKAATVTAQILAELDEPRATHVHIRGNFEEKGERVFPAVPSLLKTKIPETTQADRLAFSRALFSPDNPLTARVTVNRIWKHFFGQGLVRTLDDFGTRGDYPSHPELLDWLAVEFMETGWDVKHLQRLIVTSATYQQSSARRDGDRDRENRLLARGPRRRLAAEQIRDSGLVASGLLVPRLGGPSVFPKQDKTIGQYRDETAGKWEDSPGEGQFRKSLYTFWQRMSPYPALILFDAPSRERCTVERARTNTPLQALVALNDPHFVAIGRAFGERIRKIGKNSEERIRFAFWAALSRPATGDELNWFKEFVGESDDPEIWFQLAQVLLNLDETITKE